MTLEDVLLTSFDMLDGLITGIILFGVIALDELEISMLVTTEGSILVVLLTAYESSIDTKSSCYPNL